MTRERRVTTRLLLAAALLATSACTPERPRIARVSLGLAATALPSGTTAVRLSVQAADMATVAADLPLDGGVLTLEIPAGRDRLFTADAWAGGLRTHGGSTTVPELVAGQETTVSIRLLPLGTVDTTPPQVVSTAPASGATGVAAGTLVVADFTEPLDPASVTTAGFTLLDGASAPVAGTVTLSPAGTTATFAPLVPLAPSTTYTATLATALQDLAGNPLAAPVSWSFTTAAPGDVTPPHVVSVSPPLDASTRWIYVPIDTPITVTFSEPMDPATVSSTTFFLRDAGLNPVAASVSYAGTTAVLTPSSPLTPFAWYYATVTTGAHDLAGNPLDVVGWPTIGGNVSWSIPASGPPLQGSPPSPPESIAAGGTHTLVVTGPGFVCAWGTNNGGALGTGQAIGVLQPTPRPIPYVGWFNDTKVHARSWFSEAVASTGNVSIWGWGPALGLPAQNNPTPTQWFSGLPAPAYAVSPGYAHSLGLVSPGAIVGWGDEGGGRLGPPLGNGGPRAITPLQDGGYRAVAAGGAHSLALRVDGAVLAWGDNTYGQLGDGTTTGRSNPLPVPGLTDVAFLSAGDWFSIAVRYDRTVWAWGHNNQGQLGIGTFADSHVPVQVATLPSTVAAVSAGAAHVLALLQDGTVRAWGHNAAGKLGDGTTVDRSAPVAVTGLASVAEVSAGEFHSVARLADGTVWTWGGNSLGQLGDGTTTSSPVPIPVTIDTTAPTVAASVPAGGAVDVATNAAIVVVFSEPVSPWTVSDGSFAVTDAGGLPVAGPLTPAGARVIFRPYAPLAPNTVHSVSLGGSPLRDLFGNPLAPVSWSFTTGAGPDLTPPTVLATTPANAATAVPVNALVSADFSEPLDPASVGPSSFVLLNNSSGTPVAGTLTLSASGTTATFSPAAPLAGSTTYQAILSATAPNAVQDLAGNWLAVPVVWSFTTAP